MLFYSPLNRSVPPEDKPVPDSRHLRMLGAVRPRRPVLHVATLVAEMGFDFAESLTVFRAFVGDRDADIAALVERA
jgi:hypothetical protein